MLLNRFPISRPWWHALVLVVACTVFPGCFESQSPPIEPTPAVDADGAQKADAEATPAEGLIQAVATTNIIADLVQQIGGEFVTVTSLMGPGVDPHLYKASEGDVGRLLGADIIFYNGLHLEGKMVDFLANLPQQGKTAVAVAEAVPTDQLLDYSGGGGLYDPHVWMDAQLWERCAIRVADALKAHAPEHAAAIDGNLFAFAGSLRQANTYARERAEELASEQRIMVTAHDAFGYFGRAYGFEVRGLLGVSTAAEAGTADVDELATFIVERNVPAIFVESTISDRYLRALQEAVAARSGSVAIGGSLYADALGEADGPAGTYLRMFKLNIDTIVDALLVKK